MNSSKKNSKISFDELFPTRKSFAFSLLLILLFFNAFRPDKLLPGGSVLTYFPTVIAMLLLPQWIAVEKKRIKNSQTIFYLLIIFLSVCYLPFVRNFGFAYGAIKGIIIYGITSYLFIIQFVENYNYLGGYIRIFTSLSVFFAVMGIIGAGKVSIPLLGDENDFCLFVNFMIPFAFFLGQNSKESKKKWYYNGIVVILLVANVTSFSRGGFVGLVAVALYLFFQSRRKVFYILFVMLVGFAIASFAPPQYISEISGIGLQSANQDTGAERIKSWKAGWRMFKDHPVFGVGLYNFGPWFPDYWQDEEGLRSGANMWGRVAHSLYFTLLPELGIIGTFFFLAMLWGNFKDHKFICSLEKNKVEYLECSTLTAIEKNRLSDGIRLLYFFSKAYSGAMIAYLATGIFISVLWYEYFWKLTAFWVVTGNLARKTENFLMSNQNKPTTETVE